MTLRDPETRKGHPDQLHLDPTGLSETAQPPRVIHVERTTTGPEIAGNVKVSVS